MSEEERLEERGVVVVVVATGSFAGIEGKTLMGFANLESFRVAMSAVIGRN